ncbi:MAG: cysteine desulfurase [bacterium]|nr:cysteine desulfurase [bacterium]
MSSDAIYLDYNATTPLRPEALAVMSAVLRDDFGNPSSVHWAGAAARDRLALAREQVASLMGAAPESIVFTSGATESNNTVLYNAALRAPRHGDHIVTCATEHPSILEPLDELRERGLRVTLLPVDSDGRLDPERFAASLESETLLATVMWANNETGVIQPVPELASIAREHEVTFHTDAVQALGKTPLHFADLAIDYASLAAHKLGGPKGVGALYVRPGLHPKPLFRGGGQERQRRAGTENVASIAGFGAACAAAQADLEERAERLGELRERLWSEIQSKVADAQRNGAVEFVLPHVLNLSFAGADGDALVEALDLEGIAIASGAACHSGTTEPSHVLLAMGVDPDYGSGSIRVSLGPATRAAEIDRLIAVLPGIVERVRVARKAERRAREAARR